MFSAPAEDPWLIGVAINDLLEWVIVAASSTKCQIFASTAEDQWTLQLRLNGPHFCEALSPVKRTISTAKPRTSTWESS